MIGVEMKKLKINLQHVIIADKKTLVACIGSEENTGNGCLI